MQSGAFLRAGDIVANIDRNGVAPIGLDRWSRECAVDKLHREVSPEQFENNGKGILPERYD